MIKDPKTGKTFLNLYKFNKRKGVWKVAQSFKMNTPEDIKKIVLELELMNVKLGVQSPS